MTYLVIKKARIMRVIGVNTTIKGLSYTCVEVTPDESGTSFVSVEYAENEIISSEDVYLVDTNFFLIMNTAKKLIDLV